MVCKNGKDIVTNTKIVSIAAVFKSLAEGSGSLIEFVVALFGVIYDGSGMDAINIHKITEKNLIKERNLIKSNPLANAVLVQILRKEATNIELSFQGFM